MRRRRNPDSAPAKKKFNLGGMKNWLILGGVGIGGILAFKYFTKHEAEIKADVKAASGPKIPGPDLNGPPVKKFDIASTRSKICITSKVKGMVYAPITSTNQTTGYATFSAPVSGNFTRRLLCSGGQRVAAEIKPTVSGALGDILEESGI